MTADGGEIPNLGEKRVEYRIHEGLNLCSLFQVADVRKLLLSVPRLTASGHDVCFKEMGGTITHPKRRGMTNFKKRGGVYVFDTWVPPFPRPGR